MASASGPLVEVVNGNKWPRYFAQCISDSKDAVAFRYVLVDNSRSMLKRDGNSLVEDKSGNSK